MLAKANTFDRKSGERRGGTCGSLNILRGLAGDLWIDQAQERLTPPGRPRHRQCRFRLAS